MRKLSIIGCGTIGNEVAAALDRGQINMDLACIYDVDKKKAIELKRRLKNASPENAGCLADAVTLGDLIFEATGAGALKPIAEECFKKGKDMFVMSVGGLILHPEILVQAQSLGRAIFFPSGAIVGLDGIQASKLAKIESISLNSTKPLKSLVNSPGLTQFLKSQEKRIEDIKQAQTIFEGNAKEAIQLFPQNVNVSAALAIIGIGAEKTRVTIIADPFSDKNVHEIKCVSAAGIIYTKTENVPHPENPKTSYLAILSALSKLAELEPELPER